MEQYNREPSDDEVIIEKVALPDGGFFEISESAVQKLAQGLKNIFDHDMPCEDVLRVLHAMANTANKFTATDIE